MSPVLPRRLGLAALFVGLAALAHQAGVHPDFHAISVPIVVGDLQPTERVLHVALPDLSALRQSLPILSGTLANGSPRQHIELAIGGRRVDLELADNGHDRFALALSEGTARAVTSRDSRGHDVVIAGEHGRWHLTELSAANVYAAAGAMAFVVPRQVQPRPPPPGLTWLALSILGILSVAWGFGFSRRAIRRAHAALSTIILLALAAASVLPAASGVRLLFTPWLYWLAIGALFAPAVIRCVRGASRSTRHVGRRVARWWHAHPLTFERGAVLLGLVALAISQPVFEVLHTSPEFFVARNTSAATAIGAAMLIAIGLPMGLLAIEWLVRRFSAAAASLAFYGLVALLVALMVHPWLRRRELADAWVMAELAGVIGAATALAAWRSGVLRQILAALAPAALVVPVLFFAGADVRGSLVPAESHVSTPPLTSTPPIVLVVFDEFPLHSLLDADGQIDAVRFPNFAALARDATWFRETTSVSSQTVWAVPAIASGRYPVSPNAVPTLRFYPANLFTVLADRYQMHVFGRFLQLCPEDTCQRDVAGPGDGPLSLVEDLAVVWLHVVLPSPLTERLPPVVGDWMGFARAGKWRSSGGQRIRNDRLGEFDRFVATVGTSSARLYFLHSLLPHMPFEYVPSGHRYDAPDYQNRDENGAGLFQRVSPEYADALHQRHLLQVGFVDALVGRLIARLKQLGIYDQTLLVVTADHGASYREGVPRRGAQPQNLADIVRVPLFIKRPGQCGGAVMDGVAESVDILPTIADVLGMTLPFPVDGQSLVRENRASRTTRTFIERSFTRIRQRDVTNWQPSSQAALARRLSRFGVGEYDSFYAVAGTREMLNRPASDYSPHAGTLRVRLTSPVAIDVDPQGDTWPLHVRGRVLGRPTAPLAVVVNGRIAATTSSYLERGASVFSTMIPESALRPGRNEIAVALVEQVGSATTLLWTRR